MANSDNISETFELEKTNLEVHVAMSRQRYSNLQEKIETLDERIDSLTSDLKEFKTEHAQNIAEIKQVHLTSITALRHEQSDQMQGTTKVVVGAAATVIGGLLSVIVVLLIAYM